MTSVDFKKEAGTYLATAQLKLLSLENRFELTGDADFIAAYATALGMVANGFYLKVILEELEKLNDNAPAIAQHLIWYDEEGKPHIGEEPSRDT